MHSFTEHSLQRSRVSANEKHILENHLTFHGNSPMVIFFPFFLSFSPRLERGTSIEHYRAGRDDLYGDIPQ